MKALLTVGYDTFLFEDEKKAMAALKAFTGAIKATERMVERPDTRRGWEDVIEVDMEYAVVRLEIKMVSPSQKIVKTGGHLRLT